MHTKKREKQENGVELLTIAPAEPQTRIQRYLELLTNDNHDNFIRLFNQLEQEHQDIIKTDRKLIPGCKKDIYIFVTKMICNMKQALHGYTHYDAVYKIVKSSAIMKMHTEKTYSFWPMEMTESQIQLLISIRNAAKITLEKSIAAEHTTNKHADKDIRILQAIDKALQMNLFVEPLGNGFIKHSCELELRALYRNEQQRQGVYPMSFMPGM
jgi:hypothetical protein